MAKLRFLLVSLLFVGFSCVSVTSLQAQDDKKKEEKKEMDIRDQADLLARLADMPGHPVPVMEVSSY